MRFTPGYRRFALPTLADAVVVTVVFPPLGAALLAVDAFVLWFFRDPERSPPGESGVVAPADGHVSVIRVKGGRVRVGVFMNITDMHVNRAPVSGSIRTVTHRPGAHRPTFSKDSDRNERVDIELNAGAGDREMPLIVGAFARRIHSYIAPGDELIHGQKLGHIDFGSWADVPLPPKFDSEDAVVKRGESVWAGEAILARRE